MLTVSPPEEGKEGEFVLIRGRLFLVFVNLASRFRWVCLSKVRARARALVRVATPWKRTTVWLVVAGARHIKVSEETWWKIVGGSRKYRKEDSWQFTRKFGYFVFCKTRASDAPRGRIIITVFPFGSTNLIFDVCQTFHLDTLWISYKRDKIFLSFFRFVYTLLLRLLAGDYKI